MSQKHLVCQGATCQCQFGTQPDTLKVKTQSKHFINDDEGKEKLTATHRDIGKTLAKNTFGNCAKMNNNPCQATITEWSGFYDKITLEDNAGHPLLEDSKATCPIGGKDCISIINHGQTAQITKQNIKNANKEALKILCPMMKVEEDMYEEEEDNYVSL